METKPMPRKGGQEDGLKELRMRKQGCVSALRAKQNQRHKAKAEIKIPTMVEAPVTASKNANRLLRRERAFHLA